MTDDEVKRNIAANVVRLRGERSRYDLAKSLEIAAIHLTRIERGEHTPGPGLLSRIADEFGVTIDVLILPPNAARKKIRQTA